LAEWTNTQSSKKTKEALDLSFDCDELDDYEGGSDDDLEAEMQKIVGDDPANKETNLNEESEIDDAALKDILPEDIDKPKGETKGETAKPKAKVKKELTEEEKREKKFKEMGMGLSVEAR